MGRSPLLRLQSDEKLVALIRRGAPGAFEVLVQRYQPRLLAFCRHMLSSQEDAEDVLQEVFAASFNALLADDRSINLRPWLYRIARNRCLNHLRKPRAAGQDSMDVFERDNGVTTAETVHRREEFRHIVADVQELPETQRTALLMREIDALSYDQIAEAMETTVPSVKSLLVRARVGLAEASEARLLTCAEVRLELGQVAEGLTKSSAPVRRHLKTCERCRTFRTELRTTSKALAAVFPVGALVIIKKLGLAKLAFGGGAAAGSAAGGGTVAAGGAGLAASGAATAAGSAAAGGAISAGVGAVTSKAAAGMAAAVLVTAGAVEVKQVARDQAPPVQAAVAAPRVPVAKPAPVAPAKPKVAKVAKAPEPAPEPAVAAVPPAPAAVPVAAPAPVAPPVQEGESVATLPPRTEPLPTPVTQVPPGEPPIAEPPPPTQPPATEPTPPTTTPVAPATPPPAEPALPAPAPAPLP